MTMGVLQRNATVLLMRLLQLRLPLLLEGIQQNQQPYRLDGSVRIQFLRVHAEGRARVGPGPRKFAL